VINSSDSVRDLEFKVSLRTKDVASLGSAKMIVFSQLEKPSCVNVQDSSGVSARCQRFPLA
jgi:hypothetical protein